NRPTFMPGAALFAVQVDVGLAWSLATDAVAASSGDDTLTAFQDEAKATAQERRVTACYQSVTTRTW
ncbi:MAG TPA: hypothetical protein VIP78_10810, partial [Candidatus Dormibacteraeota bacterium]